jgi:hypothetical protein
VKELACNNKELTPQLHCNRRLITKKEEKKKIFNSLFDKSGHVATFNNSNGMVGINKVLGVDKKNKETSDDGVKATMKYTESFQKLYEMALMQC